MEIINEKTIIVHTSTELKETLEKNNTYDYIYLGNNITLETGIKIAQTKINITIDGTYENQRHTLTDKKTLSSSDTISVSYSTIQKVTICNMDIIGNNYYGIIYVPENNQYKNTIVEYNNITYNGPQISFNPSGLTRFIDSDITIADGTLTTGNEVAECNQIELGGITNINHTSKSNSAFWFRNENPSLTILGSSTINFISTYRELFYGPTNLTFTILSNSYFSVTSNNGMAYANYATETTTISANSTFILKQTSRNGNYPTWQSNGTITLNDNSSLSIINNYPNIQTTNYNINFSNKGSLILNNPKTIILYNEKANIINTTSTIPFEFKISRINLFDKTIKIDDNISLETLPTYAWYKTNENTNIKGTFTSTKCTIEEHNITEQDLPDLTNFIFANKKILSIGAFYLRINALTNTDTSIKGTTKPNSSILISYNETNSIVLADEEGNFKYEYDTPLDIGTNITITAKEKDSPIYQTKKNQIIYSGELIIDKASSQVKFKLEPINNNPILCPRENELEVIIIDTRITSTNWKLYATATESLKTTTNEEFEGEIIFKNNSATYSLTNQKILVYEGTTNDGNTKTTKVTWNENEGILLMINGKIITGKEYTTKILWSIEE